MNGHRNGRRPGTRLLRTAVPPPVGLARAATATPSLEAQRLERIERVIGGLADAGREMALEIGALKERVVELEQQQIQTTTDGDDIADEGDPET